jgi:hypothetical protein
MWSFTVPLTAPAGFGAAVTAAAPNPSDQADIDQVTAVKNLLNTLDATAAFGGNPLSASCRGVALQGHPTGETIEVLLTSAVGETAGASADAVGSAIGGQIDTSPAVGHG